MRLISADDGTIWLITKHSRRYAAEELKKLKKHRFVKILAAETDGKVVGFCVVWIIPPEAELHYIEIFKPFRKRGFGKLLLKNLQRYLKEVGVEKLYLEVSEKNTVAVELYRKSGFETVGKRKNYYGEGEDAILMKKTISLPNREGDLRC